MSQSASTLDISAAKPDYTGMMAELGEAFASGRTRPLEWRARQLSGLLRMMEECEDELLNALKADLGKPAQEAWMTELSYVSGAAAYARRRLKRWSRPS